MMLTPPAIAAWQSPDNIARQAWYSATKEDEQAVSNLRDGPMNLNVYESCPLMNARKVPRKCESA